MGQAFTQKQLVAMEFHGTIVYSYYPQWQMHSPALYVFMGIISLIRYKFYMPAGDLWLVFSRSQVQIDSWLIEASWVYCWLSPLRLDSIVTRCFWWPGHSFKVRFSYTILPRTYITSHTLISHNSKAKQAETHCFTLPGAPICKCESYKCPN